MCSHLSYQRRMSTRQRQTLRYLALIHCLTVLRLQRQKSNYQRPASTQQRQISRSPMAWSPHSAYSCRPRPTSPSSSQNLRIPAAELPRPVQRQRQADSNHFPNLVAESNLDHPR
jgi:hypothetical protein